MNVHLRIDHVVLEGLPVEQGDDRLLQAAVEAELTRLLADGPITPDLHTGGGRLSLQSEDIHVTDNDTPATLGRKVGRAVHGAISR